MKICILPQASSRPSGVFLLGFALLTSGLAALAQPQAVTVMKNFQWTDFYEPPHERQLRWLLKGAEARPRPGGEIAVQRVTLEKFLETGTRELLVELPECGFDPTTREASSPGSLRMQFQEGRFTLEGEGFWWQHTNTLLVISNRVRTSIRGGWFASQAAAPGLGDAQVLADQFSFTGQTTQAVYRGHVRVTGTNLALACERLSFCLPTKSAGMVDNLTAEQDVAIDFGELHAAGDRAVYAPGAGSMQLSGGATWQAQGREGRGEELLLDGVSRSLRVNGRAELKLPLGNAEFIPQRSTASAPSAEAANRVATITSARYELQTNQVSFSGEVQAIERAGEEVRSRLTCDSLLATFGPSNQLQTLVANRDVVIEQGERRLSGAHATYDGATGEMELTGNPEWRDGERSGQGEVLLANLRREEFALRGNASLSLPHAQSETLFGALLGGATNRADKPAHTIAASPPPPTRITSDEYSFAPETVAFRGRVRVDDAQMQLTTDSLTLKLAPGGTNVVSITADQNVVMSLVETNGQISRVTCVRAVYAAGGGMLALTGAPVLRQHVGTNTNTFAADVILLNPTTGEVRAERGIRSSVVVPGGTATNAPALPFKTKPARRKK